MCFTFKINYSQPLSLCLYQHNKCTGTFIPSLPSVIVEEGRLVALQNIFGEFWNLVRIGKIDNLWDKL